MANTKITYIYISTFINKERSVFKGAVKEKLKGSRMKPENLRS